MPHLEQTTVDVPVRLPLRDVHRRSDVSRWAVFNWYRDTVHTWDQCERSTVPHLEQTTWETCTVAVCPNLLLSFLLPADPVLIQCNSIQTCTVPLLWLTPARRSEAELHSEKTSTVAGFHVYWDGWMHVSVIASAHSFCNGDIWQLRVLRLMLPVTVACGGIERYLW